MTTSTTTTLELVDEYITNSECESSILYNNIRQDAYYSSFSHNFVHDATQVQHWLEKYIPELTEYPLWSTVSFDDHASLASSDIL
eukprot:1115867-Rhodomonas_salina.1